MAGVVHPFVSLKADGADATQVRPSNWNDEHEYIGGGLGDLLYVGIAGSYGRMVTGLTAAAGVPYWSGAGVVPVMTTAPTLTGTNFTGIPFAALSDSANIARLDQAETIAAAWTFSAAPTLAGTNITGLPASAVSSGTFADARVAASNVTQHQASLAILETQITDGALLARVGGTETISGAWTFSTAPTVPAGSAGTPGLVVGAATTGIWSRVSGTISFGSLGTDTAEIQNSGILWLKKSTSALALGAGPELFLYPDAANTLALRNVTNPQAFLVYNTTDGTNKEYIQVSWSANQANVLTTATGTGTFRDIAIGPGGGTAFLKLISAGATRWLLSSSGHFLANADNTYDIGASGATRPRNLFVGTNITAGGAIRNGSVTSFGSSGGSAAIRNWFTGAFTSTGVGYGAYFDGALTPASGQGVSTLYNEMSAALPAATSLVAGIHQAATAITLASGAVTTAASVYIAGAPTISGGGAITNAYALRVNSGNSLFTGAVLSNSATAGVGYSAGAGGTVTQLTSKSTTVVLNTVTGEITMNSASLAAGTAVSFVLTNSAIAPGDYVMVQHVAAGSAGIYTVSAAANGGGGSATITVRNNAGGAEAAAIVLKYVVFKAATS